MKHCLNTYSRNTLLLIAVAMMTACAAVSFTHVDEVSGGNLILPLR